jgi:hypothetical protein
VVTRGSKHPAWVRLQFFKGGFVTGLTFILVLICLIVLVVGMVGLFKPLTNLKMKNRWAAACWVVAGFIALGAVAINSPAPPTQAPQPAPKRNAQAVTGPAEPAWLRATNFCGGTSTSYRSSVACGDVLTFDDAPPACREFATLVVRGRRDSFEAGRAEIRCGSQTDAVIDPESGREPPMTDAFLEILRANASVVRSCVAGDKAACRAVEVTEVNGFCGSYAGLITLQQRGVERDENLEGYYLEKCRRELTFI